MGVCSSPTERPMAPVEGWSALPPTRTGWPALTVTGMPVEAVIRAVKRACSVATLSAAAVTVMPGAVRVGRRAVERGVAAASRHDPVHLRVDRPPAEPRRDDPDQPIIDVRVHLLGRRDQLPAAGVVGDIKRHLTGRCVDDQAAVDVTESAAALLAEGLRDVVQPRVGRRRAVDHERCPGRRRGDRGGRLGRGGGARFGATAHYDYAARTSAACRRALIRKSLPRAMLSASAQ